MRPSFLRVVSANIYGIFCIDSKNEALLQMETAQCWDRGRGLPARSLSSLCVSVHVFFAAILGNSAFRFYIVVTCRVKAAGEAPPPLDLFLHAVVLTPSLNIVFLF